LFIINYQFIGDRVFNEHLTSDRSSAHHIPTKIPENPSKLLWCLVNFRVDVVFGE
jgi:hypothetical protein